MINLDVDNESGVPLKHIPPRRAQALQDSEHDLKRLALQAVMVGAAISLLLITLVLTLRSSSGTGVMPASDPSFHDVLLDAPDHSVWLRLLDPVPVAAKYSSPSAADPESAIVAPGKPAPTPAPAPAPAAVTSKAVR